MPASGVATPMPSRLTSLPEWQALQHHAQVMRGRHLRDLFASDVRRGERLSAEAAGFLFDYSKQRIDDETLRLLLALADALDVHSRVEAMFRGERINTTEDR